MKYASNILGDAMAEPKKADLNKLSHLQPGQVVRTIDGSAYRVKSKIATPDGSVFKLANLQGKPVPTPADFRPVSHAMARFASWLRYHLAFNKDFDLYINSYIEQFNNSHPADKQLPYPIGPDDKPFRWSKWFQSEIAPKLFVQSKNYEDAEAMKDEAIHEMLFTVLGERHILDEFTSKMKNFQEAAQRLELGKQLTIYLARNFKYRVEEMNKKLKPETLGREDEQYLSYLKEKLQKTRGRKQRAEIEAKIQEAQGSLDQLGEFKDTPRESPMWQPGHGEEGDEGEINVLEQEQYGVGQDEFTSAEAQRDVQQFRGGFGTWLQQTQGKKVGASFLALFDIYWDLVSQAGKSRAVNDVEKSEKLKKKEETEPWMIQRGDLEGVWQERTGLSFGSLKDYLGRLPGLMEEYITTHAAQLGETSIFVDLMNRIKKQRPAKARPAYASALNLAGVEEDFSEAKSEVVSPDTVDNDIQQPTVSVDEAGKQSAHNPHTGDPAKPEWFTHTYKGEERKEEDCPGCGEALNNANGPYCRGSYCPHETDPSDKEAAVQGAAPNAAELLESIRAGDTVTILRPAGMGRGGQEWAEATGRAVMKGPAGWVLNMGGKHGTPGIAGVENLVRVRKSRRASAKIASLIAGSDLTPEMRKQVQNAFIYRWTFDNPQRAKVYHCDKCDVAREPYVNEQSAEGHQHPTIPMISDEQWIREHAFDFTLDGRLKPRGHAEPVYLAQHNARRVSSVQQKFAIEKAAYCPEVEEKTSAETGQLACCGGWHNRHKSNCSVYNENFDKTIDMMKGYRKEGMLGHDICDADGQAIRLDIADDTGRSPHDWNKNGAGSNSGKDDPRGAGDLWRENFYETEEGISPSAMMSGIKTGQGSGNTTTTMQEQNVTDPTIPGHGQPMAVPEPIDQQPGPHSPNAPSTAPRSPNIQPRIVNVPPGTEAEGGIPMTSSEDADWESLHPEDDSSLDAREGEEDPLECPRCKGFNIDIDPTEDGGYALYCEDCEGVTHTQPGEAGRAGFRWHGEPLENLPSEQPETQYSEDENAQWEAFMQKLHKDSRLKFASLPGAGQRAGMRRVVLAEDWYIYVVDPKTNLMYMYDTEVWPEWGNVENAWGEDKTKPQPTVEAMIPYCHKHPPVRLLDDDKNQMNLEQFMASIKDLPTPEKEAADEEFVTDDERQAQEEAQLDQEREPDEYDRVMALPEEQKAEWLLQHGWQKENEWHGATWWMRKQMWYLPEYEESIPYQDTDDAVEKQLNMMMDDAGNIKQSAEKVKLKCNECGKRFSVSPNAADPSCPKCHGVDWDVENDVLPKQGATPVLPNVVQQQNARPPMPGQPTGQGGVSVALMPGQEEEQQGQDSGFGGKQPEKRSIQPELAQAEFLMRGSLEDAEERRLAKQAGLNSFKITFEDGNTITTDFNGSLEEAEAYYLNNYFNFGDTDENPKDNLQKGVSVEQLGADPGQGQACVECGLVKPDVEMRDLEPDFPGEPQMMCLDCQTDLAQDI